MKDWSNRSSPIHRKAVHLERKERQKILHIATYAPLFWRSFRLTCTQIWPFGQDSPFPRELLLQ